MVKIPIIFYQQGYQEFIEYALAQARSSNPSSPIYLICDNAVMDKLIYKNRITLIHYEDFSKLANEFIKVYEHFSSNPYEYELVCIVRWFVIYDFMEENKISTAFICDSDCLIYSDITELYPAYNAKYGSLIIVNDQEPFIWVVSGAESYWNLIGLHRFVNFLYRAYNEGITLLLEDKIIYHKINNIPGGVCDMTLLYKFYINQKTEFSNIISVKNGGAFDMSIGNPDNEFINEYQHNGNTKEISFLSGIPYCYNNVTQTKIKLHLLHFQGKQKKLIKAYYKGPIVIHLKLWFRSVIKYGYLAIFQLKRKLKVQ